MKAPEVSVVGSLASELVPIYPPATVAAVLVSVVGSLASELVPIRWGPRRKSARFSGWLFGI